MTTIILNNTEFELVSFNRNTSFYENNISSTANCDIRVSNSAALQALINTTITTLQIKYGNEVIYNLTDISAKINTMNEYLNTDHISTSLGLTFDLN
jgi:hypothetical protein